MNRFERARGPLFGAKAFSRSEVNRSLDVRASMDPGAFLGRLWALFGPATSIDDGFSYELHDRATGMSFTAYSGASGPSYGGPLDCDAQLRPVVEALEVLLDATAPVDCELSFGADLEYGGGSWAMGWKDGRSFVRSP